MRPTTNKLLADRIDGHWPDLLDPSGETALDVLSTPDPVRGWPNLGELAPAACSPAPPALDGTHEHVPVINSFGVGCTVGAIGSCIRFGYQPW